MDLQKTNGGGGGGGGGGGVLDGVTMTRFSVNQVNDSPEADGGGPVPASVPVNHYYGGGDQVHRDSYILSLRQLTKEAIPRIDQYRNTRSISYAYRPTLEELHNGTVTANGQNILANGALPLENGKSGASAGAGHGDGSGHVKFGWIEGVLVLNLMSLWGPMLFLRTSWLVGQGGIIEACVVILFSALITTITALSTSAIATNGEVKGGGTYYMLSRSLGAEYGGAIGLIFAFANMVGVAMNIVGFCEAFTDLLKIFNLQIVDGGINDTRIVGIAAVAFCLCICIIGMEWEQKAQVVLLIILLAAIGDVIVGSFIPPNEDKRSKGITGWNLDVASQNALPDFRGETFFSLFSIYFPSSTGILSGANISGELKDPQSSIPKGTLLAILLTTLSYVLFAIMSGFCIVRDAGGFVNGTLVECGYHGLNGTLIACNYGLQNQMQMLEILSGFRWLIYAGNFAATLSSALACLVGAPRVFQALCRDKIYPYIYWFEKGYGKADDPYRCYALTFVIASCFILIGDLDSIAPIMSNFFMAAFALINFAVFHAAFAKSPGFRPSFKYWNMWVSAFGALLCFVVMFIMDWLTAIVTVVICFFLYLYLYYNKPEVNWGSSAQAETYRQALKATQELNITEEHVKNYRPHILVFSGKPSCRPQLVDFAYSITKGIGLTICGHVVRNPVSQRRHNEMEKDAYRFMNSRKCKAFYSSIEDNSLESGAKALIQSVGVGKLRPNMLMMGYKSNWQGCEPREVLEYFSLLHYAFDRYLGVGILRMPQGLDYSYFTEEGEMLAGQSTNTLNASQISLRSGTNVLNNTGSMASINSALTQESTQNSRESPNESRRKNKGKSTDEIMSNIPVEILDNINWFRQTQKMGTIDVWWLYDDGGLTLLIPYILSTRKAWHKCKLRVFSLANSQNQLGEEERNMAALLSKFRIDCTEVTVLADLGKPAAESTVREFNEIVEKFRDGGTNLSAATDEDAQSGGESDQQSITLTQAELDEHKERSNRYMRIREHLRTQSTQSTIIVMTLPMPRKNRVPAALYMSWLEMLTKDMPPFLLIRGNQTNVLTFYS